MGIEARIVVARRSSVGRGRPCFGGGGDPLGLFQLELRLAGIGVR
jgi:hypothetical protein